MPPRSLLSDEQMSSPPPAGTPRQLRRRAGRGTVSRLPGAGAGRGGAGRAVSGAVSHVSRSSAPAPGECALCRPQLRRAPHRLAARSRSLPSALSVSSRLLPSALLSVRGATEDFLCSPALYNAAGAGWPDSAHRDLSNFDIDVFQYSHYPDIECVLIYFYRIKNPLKTIL